ncbi:MAG TPA: hypothetical protein VED01_03240 [Burkholderiales bacterium]|nr:hypothetical protein [Burkholderiales bacterium]
MPVSRITRAPSGWSEVGRSATAAQPTVAANSGLQGGMFGQNTGALMALYDRAIAAGMSPSRASQLIGSDMAPEQFLAQIQQLEQTRATLGEPVFTPARTSEQTQVRTQAQAEGLRALYEQLAAAEAASQQLTPEQQAIEDRYGHDMAWLDPSFQYQAQTVAPITTRDALQYGTTADPAAQALERQAIEQLFARASAGPSADERNALATQQRAVDDLFARSRQGPSYGEQEGLALQRNAIDRLNAVADRGATGEERSSLNRVSEVAGELRNRAAIGATTEERAALADQRRMMESLYGDYEQGASDVELEAQAAQREAMNELFGVWRGGGATALERARRAQARAESENWLQGQRKADMQDLAERGMSGSGAELASLQADRQAAASRLSMADLETDAALEERALQALLSGSGVAGELLQGEGGIQARRLQQLLGASDASRGISGTLGDIEARGTQQLAASGGLEGDAARAWGDIEARVLNALQGASTGAANLTGAYGDIEARALQALLGANQGAASITGAYGDIESRGLQALQAAQSGAGAMREASDRYVSGNADRLLDAATFNANAINRSASENRAFIQQAYRDTMADRMRWDLQTRDLQAQVARSLLGSDVQENQFGFDQGWDTAASDVAARNRAQGNYNTSVQGAHSGSAPVIYDAQAGVNNAAQAGLRTGGQTVQQAGNAVLTYFSGGAGGMAMGRQPYSSGSTGSAVMNPTDAQNPYRNYGRY